MCPQSHILSYPLFFIFSHSVSSGLKFDSFFDKLSYFNIHCKNGLFSRSKVHNYFEYYFRILTTNERKSIEFINVIDSYLSYYGYNNVKELLEDYKKRENSSKNFFKKLKYEILK